MEVVAGTEELRKINKRGQYSLFLKNAQYILGSFDEIFGISKEQGNIKTCFTQRFKAAQQEKKHKSFAELQRDLGAFILLQDNGFDFSRYIGDTSDLYQVAQEFIRKTGSCTDIAVQFPQMVKDSITSIDTNGQEPPAGEMIQAQEFFAERVRKSMDTTMI